MALAIVDPDAVGDRARAMLTQGDWTVPMSAGLVGCGRAAPFGVQLRALMREHEIGLRPLAELTAAVDGRGLRHSYIGYLARGAKQPTPENIELLAACLGVAPDHFDEYRVHLAALEAARLARRLGPDVVLERLDELG